MVLTYNDFKNGQKLFTGKVSNRFYFNGAEIFKLSSNEFFIRTDLHILQSTSFFPDIEVFRFKGQLVLVFLDNDYYTFIEPINVIESQTVNQFDGFEPDKKYELRNGQIWQQVDDTFTPNYLSTGYVKIINKKTMMVDNLNIYPTVTLIN